MNRFAKESKPLPLMQQRRLISKDAVDDQSHFPAQLLADLQFNLMFKKEL